MCIRAVIFDCDGTLLDSERIYMSTWNTLGKRLGYEIPEQLLLETRGKSDEEGKRLFAEVMGEDFPYQMFKDVRRDMNEVAVSATPKEKLIKPGVERLFQWLKEHGMKIAVASAKTYKMTSDHLKYAELYEQIDVVLGKDMVEHIKPAPDVFLKAAEKLGVSSEECIVVGDTHSDVRAAFAAGMKMVFVPDLIPVDEEIEEKSFKILNQIDELIEILEKR